MMAEGPEHLCCEERLTVKSRAEKAQGDLTNVQKFLKEACKEDRDRLFTVVLSEKAGGRGHKLENRIPLNKQILLLESNRVLLKVAQRHYGMSRSSLDMAMGSWL